MPPVDDAEIVEVARALADKVLGGVDPPASATRSRRAAFWWGIRWLFRPKVQGEAERYGAAVGCDWARATKDVSWVLVRLKRLASAKDTDREALVHKASLRLLVSRAKAEEDQAVLATEKVLQTLDAQRTPDDFRQWPVEQRTEWYREKLRRYSDAWRTALAEGDVTR